MFCTECGNPNLRRTKEPLLESFRGRKYVVPNIDRWVCDQCGSYELKAEEADKLSEALYKLDLELNKHQPS